MTADQLIPVLAIFICQAAFLAALPILVFAAASRIVNSVQDARLPWTPYIELVALAVGVGAGVIILATNIDPTTISPSQVFRIGGPWDLGVIEFLTQRANPFAYDLSGVLPIPGRMPAASGLLVFVLGAVLVYAPVLRFRSRRAIANGVRNAVVMVGGAYCTVYAAVYFLWLANKLNFWIFLLLLLLVEMRSRTQEVVLKFR